MQDRKFDTVLDKGKELCQNKDYYQALNVLLQAFENGRKDFKLINLILECYEQMYDFQKLTDFLSKVLLENDYSFREQAQLYYKLGLAYFNLGQYNQARQSFWQINKLYPNFPGLEDKLQELTQIHKRVRSRYDILLEKDLLTKEQLEEAIQKAKNKNLDVDQLLLDEYNIAKEDLGKSLSIFYETPFVSFDPSILPPFEIFEKKRLDPDFLKKYGWVPFTQKGNTIEVLMANPFDLGRLDEIRFILGSSRIEPKVTLQQDLENFVDRFYQEFSGEDLSAFEEEIIDADFEQEEEEVNDVEKIGTEQDSEVVRLVNALLVEAWKRGASDIHIEPNSVSRYCSVRLRVDGTCHEFRKLRFNLSRPIISRIKIMSQLDIAERRLPQDGKVKIKLPQVNKVVEFRVATIPTIDNQEDIVLRQLSSGKPLDLEKLGLRDIILKNFKNVIYQPYGMILVVGPTGSGKTTTLHSAMSYINTSDRKIWTAEDPVEITQEGLRQVQMNPKIGLTFASALRSFLRADPDVIMIGEMRDKETAHIGIEASLTGHLVFSTLHTNSAPETITRLLDMDLDPFNFADSLLCVLAQRLVKTLCKHCKEPYVPDEAEIEELKYEFGFGWEDYFNNLSNEDFVLYKAKGCRRCIQGYKGRIGIHELMLNSDQIKELIKYKSATEKLKTQAQKEGMVTLKQDGIIKVLQGVTDIHQVRKAARKE